MTVPRYRLPLRRPELLHLSRAERVFDARVPVAPPDYLPIDQKVIALAEEERQQTAEPVAACRDPVYFQPAPLASEQAGLCQALGPLDVGIINIQWWTRVERCCSVG